MAVKVQKKCAMIAVVMTIVTLFVLVKSNRYNEYASENSQLLGDQNEDGNVEVSVNDAGVDRTDDSPWISDNSLIVRGIRRVTSTKSDKRVARVTREASSTPKKKDWGLQYYEFLINEGSYKFWSAFQLGTALLLIYSAISAIYYAKFNLVPDDYDYEDFYVRSFDAHNDAADQRWFTSSTFERALNAIADSRFVQSNVIQNTAKNKM